VHRSRHREPYRGCGKNADEVVPNRARLEVKKAANRSRHTVGPTTSPSKEWRAPKPPSLIDKIFTQPHRRMVTHTTPAFRASCPR